MVSGYSKIFKDFGTDVGSKKTWSGAKLNHGHHSWNTIIPGIPISLQAVTIFAIVSDLMFPSIHAMAGRSDRTAEITCFLYSNNPLTIKSSLQLMNTLDASSESKISMSATAAISCPSDVCNAL